MKTNRLMRSCLCLAVLFFPVNLFAAPVPDTGQTKCYDVARNVIVCPSPGQSLYGQDANYAINPMSYTNLNGMVRDNVTGLIWELKTNKDGVPNYSNLTMRTTRTPGTTATRPPTAVMPELLAMARIPKISSMP